MLVAQASTSLERWTTFSGDFAIASTVKVQSSGRLLLGVQHRIFAYGDGNFGEVSFGDNDGRDSIYFTWILPLLTFQNKRFAAKRYTLQCDYTSDWVLELNNAIKIAVNSDLPKSFHIEKDYQLPFKGDILQEVYLPNYRFTEPFILLQDRLKFTGNRCWLSVYGRSKQGMLSLHSLKLFGSHL